MKISATNHNLWNAAARAEQRRSGGGVSSTRSELFTGGVPNVRVKNISGADVPRCGVLRIVGSVFDPSDPDAIPAFIETPALVGNLPNGDFGASFVVTHEPITDGGIGLAYLWGVVPVKINVVHEQHTHVVMADDDYEQVDSQMFGHRIIYKEAGTGQKWGLILLGFEFPELIAIGQETIPANDFGSVKVAIGSKGAEAAIGDPIAGYYRDGNLSAPNAPSGTRFLMTWLPSTEGESGIELTPLACLESE